MVSIAIKCQIPVERGNGRAISGGSWCLQLYPYTPLKFPLFLAILRRDVVCTCKGGVYPNMFKMHAKSAVKNIASRACLGWSVPSLMVLSCLSLYFFTGGNSMTV